MIRTLHAASLGFLLASAAVASDAGAPLLTLEEAVETALRDNHQLTVADAAVGGARAGMDRAGAHRRPSLDLTETFSWTTNPALVFTNKLGQEVFGPDDFDPDRLNNPDDLTNFNTMLSAAYPLYAGGKLDASLEAARYSHDAAVAGRERTRQQVVHDVLDAYSAAVLRGAHLRMTREALATARANVKLVDDLYRGGLVVESDLMQAKVRQSEVEEMLIRAESALEIARATLNLTLGRDLGTPFSLPEEVETRDDVELSLPDLIGEALLERPDLAAADAYLSAAERSVRAERSGRRPEVGLEGRYEANAEDFIGADGTNWSVFVAARIPLFDGKETRAGVAQVEARRRAAQGRRDLLRRSVELEARRSFHEVHAARKSLEQSRAAVELAGESLRIVQDRYREGLATLVELLDSETALTRARTREVATLRTLFLSRASLDLAVGRL